MHDRVTQMTLPQINDPGTSRAVPQKTASNSVGGTQTAATFDAVFESLLDFPVMDSQSGGSSLLRAEPGQANHARQALERRDAAANRRSRELASQTRQDHERRVSEAKVAGRDVSGSTSARPACGRGSRAEHEPAYSRAEDSQVERSVSGDAAPNGEYGVTSGRDSENRRQEEARDREGVPSDTAGNDGTTNPPESAQSVNGEDTDSSDQAAEGPTTHSGSVGSGAAGSGAAGPGAAGYAAVVSAGGEVGIGVASASDASTESLSGLAPSTAIAGEEESATLSGATVAVALVDDSAPEIPAAGSGAAGSGAAGSGAAGLGVAGLDVGGPGAAGPGAAGSGAAGPGAAELNVDESAALSLVGSDSSSPSIDEGAARRVGPGAVKGNGDLLVGEDGFRAGLSERSLLALALQQATASRRGVPGDEQTVALADLAATRLMSPVVAGHAGSVVTPATGGGISGWQSLPANLLGPGAAFTAIQAEVGSAGFGAELAEKMHLFVGKGLQSAQITLNPAELGPLEIKLHLQKDQAQIQVQTSVPLVRDLVEQSAQRLRDLLAEQGMNLARFDVSSRHSGQDGGGQGGSRERDDRAADQHAVEENSAGRLQTLALSSERLVDDYV